MTDHFTCPSCGWPQGAIGTVDPPPHPCPSCGTLAAPQGQGKCVGDFREREWCLVHNCWHDDCPTDAKEGEGTFPRISSAGLRGAKEVSKRQLGTTIAKKGEEDGPASERVLPMLGDDNSLLLDDGRTRFYEQDGEILDWEYEKHRNPHPYATPDIAGLVERLRDGIPHDSQDSNRLMDEAADALERMANERAIEKVLWERHSKRLQAESDALVLAGSHWEDQSAEIARLRAALEDIDKYGDIASANIASAALTGREEG